MRDRIDSGPWYLIHYADLAPDHLRGGTTADHLTITTQPGRTNVSREERTAGWLGQTGDWSATALGEFDTLAALHGAIRAEGFDPGQIEWDDGGSGTVGHEASEPLVISTAAGTITARPCEGGGYNWGEADYDFNPGWTAYCCVDDGSSNYPAGWNHHERDRCDLAALLDAAGIAYERFEHSEDSYSLDYIHLRDGDVARADSIIEAVADAVRDLDIDWADALAALGAGSVTADAIAGHTRAARVAAIRREAFVAWAAEQATVEEDRVQTTYDATIEALDRLDRVVAYGESHWPHTAASRALEEDPRFAGLDGADRRRAVRASLEVPWTVRAKQDMLAALAEMNLAARVDATRGAFIAADGRATVSLKNETARGEVRRWLASLQCTETLTIPDAVSVRTDPAPLAAAIEAINRTGSPVQALPAVVILGDYAGMTGTWRHCLGLILHIAGKTVGWLPLPGQDQALLICSIRRAVLEHNRQSLVDVDRQLRDRRARLETELRDIARRSASISAALSRE